MCQVATSFCIVANFNADLLCKASSDKWRPPKILKATQPFEGSLEHSDEKIIICSKPKIRLFPVPVASDNPENVKRDNPVTLF